MPRYVVLRHEMPAGGGRSSHWDFMLECPVALRTWALPAPPDSALPLEAEALADHRLEYLVFEGPISGGRGSVARWDEGTFRLLEQSADEWKAELEGVKLRGRATWTRLAGDAAAVRWRYAYSPELSALRPEL